MLALHRRTANLKSLILKDTDNETLIKPLTTDTFLHFYMLIFGICNISY